MHDAIAGGVERLGYKVSDIRILGEPRAFRPHRGARADAAPHNPRHQSVIEDTRRTFRKLKAEREPDIVLIGHPQAMFAGTIERMRRNERPHPLLNGADAWARQLATAEADFERRVAEERR